ncbi:hypothetical protein COT42_07605 [Candidatus Saganbacteria bacterium CG08_land_8_20_14_0_20_45_16]|uniref:TolC family protein n=1 Tax=Candidatus Saganbacteria bacterium CG08_land_8_20_14_0_20_45_16 TaxID=2014293 RepID=A0A2H0XUC5_UNCSA|nr:MAG: hypothetical protein COT42_07605 [Candidatus Saganbacteria bacterium CG08_land_8_20_14_0_20_45_16]
MIAGWLGGLVAGAGQELTFQQSIDLALKQSPVILKKQAELRAAEGQAGQITANYLPNLSLAASIGKLHAEPQTTSLTIGGVTQTYSFGLDETANTNSYSASLSQVVFDGGAMFASFGMAGKGLEAARQELKKSTDQLTFDVINTYNNVLVAQKMVELNDEAVQMTERLLAQANSLKRLGMGTGADVLRAELQLAKAQMSLTKAKQGLELARNNFNAILGNDLNLAVELETIEVDSGVTVYRYEELLKLAYQNQPAWCQFVLAIGAAKDEATIARGALFPRVSLVGNYEVGSTKYSSYQSDVKNWTAVASANWNVFDGTATFNRLKEAEAKAKAKEQEEREVKQAVALQVKNADFQLISALENLEASKIALELAVENNKISEQRYGAGLGSNLEVIDAQVNLTLGKIEYLLAQHELAIAKARVNQVVGQKIY